MALLGIAIFLLVRVRSSVSDSIASLWCTFTLRPGEQECKEQTSANVKDMFGGTVGVVAAGAVDGAGCHARAERAPAGGASTEEESALVRDLPDNLKKWKWLKQQIAHAAPVHGTGDNGGIESEGAVPVKPARIKTAANKGGGEMARIVVALSGTLIQTREGKGGRQRGWSRMARLSSR
eukprot:jgi/Mesvir1/22291/Mv17050-RA.1